jgi:competence protein ComEC
MLTPVLTRWLRPLGPLAMPVAVTLGAQIGVAVPSVVVFGRLSVVGTLANLVAVPVAGLVMLYGLPASLVAGAVTPLRGVLMLPVDVGVRWVDAVATLAARLSPDGTANVVGWALVVVGVGFVARRRPDSDTDLPH